MFVRSTTVQAHPNSIDVGVKYVNHELMPTLESMDGFIGLSMLVDRQTRRCIVSSAWADHDAMRSSDERLQPMRNQLAESLGGRPQVDEWEVAAMHREHEAPAGACVRATWCRVSPDQLDRAVDIYRMASLPALSALEGFCSASLFVDRTEGLFVASTTYDTVAAMESTRGDAGTIREAGTADAGAEVLDVCEFDLVVAHLRVPELA